MKPERPAGAERAEGGGGTPRRPEPLGAHPGRTADDRPLRAQAGSGGALERCEEQLRVLASCGEGLLNRGGDALDDVFAMLGPHLELDAYGCFLASATSGEFILENPAGLRETADLRALPGAAVVAFVAELTKGRQRTLVLESLWQTTDPRATVFRELGFTTAVIGALFIDDDRPLGAVVLATRSKKRFTGAALTLIDTLVHHLTIAYERREHARRRHSEEQRKRDFLTVLAHELRNPLAPVRNALEIIRANDHARSAVERSAYAMIERQLQQIGRLADDLLDANQVVLGRVELERQRLLLESVIERAAAQSRPWIESARHELVVDLPREPISIDGDPKRLARVFSNLVNAAARCMDRGGRIVITAEVRDGVVTVLVRTRGRAVAGDNLQVIFDDAVERHDVTNGQVQTGFTAGATLVKHLVELHGGTVSARSNMDDGAEFTVHLPVVSAAELQQSPQPHEQSAAPPAPHRILIADDNADSAESMGMLLRLMGNDVRIASDGLDAVEQAAEFQPDIVLMDIGMPRLDGYEAARRIRNQGWSRDTLMVAVTGWGPSDDSEEATAAGFDRHFTKPLDPAELRRLVGGQRPH